MILALALLSAHASAATTPELELCHAAAAGDVAAIKRWIAKGADVNAMGRVRTSGGFADESPDEQFWMVVGGFVTAGLLPLVFIATDPPEFEHYHSLSCALGAPHPSREVVTTLVAAGAKLDEPAPNTALDAYFSVHASDADAAAWYAWLQGLGAAKLASANSLLVEDRATATPGALALLDAVLADGLEAPTCGAASVGDIAVLAHLVHSGDVVDTVRCLHGEDPRTLLNLAAANGRLVAVNWLLDHGALPNLVLPAESTGRTGFFQRKQTETDPPLADAMNAGANGAAILPLLLARGADPFVTDSGGRPAIDDVAWHPEYVAQILTASNPAEAVPWALAHGWPVVDPDRMPLTDNEQSVATNARNWLDPSLRALADDAARRPAILALTTRFWADALHSGYPAVTATLALTPGARASDLALSANACMPQAGESRARIHAVWGVPSQVQHGWESYLPPAGTPRDLFGHAPGSAPALQVEYTHGKVERVDLFRAADIRAHGCDAPALRYLDEPPWQRAWEFGTDEPASQAAGQYDTPTVSLPGGTWTEPGLSLAAE